MTFMYVLFTALMWKMAHHQVVVLWTLRQALPQDLCYIPLFQATVSAESHFCIDLTVTMTCHQKQCPGIPLFQVNSKYHSISISLLNGAYS